MIIILYPSSRFFMYFHTQKNLEGKGIDLIIIYHSSSQQIHLVCQSKRIVCKVLGMYNFGGRPPVQAAEPRSF